MIEEPPSQEPVKAMWGASAMTNYVYVAPNSGCAHNDEKRRLT